MIPLEYACDEAVRIRRSPDFDFATGNKPKFWYLKKPMFWFDRHPAFTMEEVHGFYYEMGLRCWYWNGEQWWYCKPKQFPTAEEAYAEYTERIANTTNEQPAPSA